MPSPTSPVRSDRARSPNDLRTGCARVASGARWVRVDASAIAPLTDDLLTSGVLDTVEPAGGSLDDPWSVDVTDRERTAALVLTLATVNFGSGWHPVITKRPGLSGATSMAAAVRDWERDEPITARRLLDVTPAAAHAIFDQPIGDPDVDELMALFSAALVDLGAFVTERFDGSFAALIESADHSAVILEQVLTAMPAFDDTAIWVEPDGNVVVLDFDKRAQIASADLHRTFGATDLGRFDDLDRLTAFADNLVPHVLGIDGVLRFDAGLRDRIDSGELLIAGSPEEVEIRALGIHGVELLRAELLARGIDTPPWRLDGILWRRGGGPRYKALPRHRARSRFY